MMFHPSSTWNMEQNVIFEVMRQPWNWLQHDQLGKKVKLVMSWISEETSFEQFMARQVTWQNWLDETETRCNARNMVEHSLNWLKGFRWLMKVDRLGDKLNTQLFRYANIDMCHVQRWTVDFHKYKWKTLYFPLIYPSLADECLFLFLRFQRG